MDPFIFQLYKKERPYLKDLIIFTLLYEHLLKDEGMTTMEIGEFLKTIKEHYTYFSDRGFYKFVRTCIYMNKRYFLRKKINKFPVTYKISLTKQGFSRAKHMFHHPDYYNIKVFRDVLAASLISRDRDDIIYVLPIIKDIDKKIFTYEFDIDRLYM